jgi:Tat protein translocase TatC
MPNTAGEMPFLDHLEELRKRILLSLVAIMAGFGVGFWITTRFQLIQIIEKPVTPFIPGGKLTVMTLTGPFMIVLKFGFILGAILASPFVLYQLWLFLSPALTSREKKAIIPSLGIGLILFFAGAAIGWFYVVPPGVEWLATYQKGAFTTLFTYESYMQLVVHLLIGMGISAELPLIMILLTSLGVTSYRMYAKLRRYAVLAAFVGGAILAPTPEVTMMILFTIPLLLLYEIGVAGAWLVEKRKARAARLAAGVIVLALCLSPRHAHAQVPLPPPPSGQLPPGAAGALPIGGQGVQRMDTSTLKRLGFPTGQRPFGPTDSIMQALLARKGFAVTRYMADSASLVVTGQVIQLHGKAATLRDDGQLEAARINYDGEDHRLSAEGQPVFFQKGQQPMIGEPMVFNTNGDSARALISSAFTAMAERGANWFLRGNIAIDSGGKRLFGAKTEFTSCDLPDPHYHFVAGKVKWVSQSVIVARPAVLYVRDIPVFWLPFIFQDTKQDRSSGILIPKFGFNDIVRTNPTYNRQITNVGYYWAPNDYIDVTASVDWYANRYTQTNGTLNYRWLDRFVTGSITLTKQSETGGTVNNTLHWDHTQKFDVSTSLRFSINYQSTSEVQLVNSFDPYATTQNITSQLNLTKTLRWGSVSLGGNREVALGTGTGTMSFPSLTISPKPFLLGAHVTISPDFSVTNFTTFNNPLTLPSVYTFGGIDSRDTAGTSSTRATSITLSLPVEIFRFTLANSFQLQDQATAGRVETTQRIPNPATGGPDSINVTTIQNANYQTGFNWQTGINLPQIAGRTLKLTPSIGVQNAASGAPLLVRSAASNGEWVSQGFKPSLGLSSAPSIYAFTNGGIGQFSRFRWTLAPSITLQYSPAASVSAAFARAFGSTITAVPAQASASVGFHQVIEGKVKAGAKDTNTDPAYLARLPKKQLIGITTSAINYDFEQAKLPGHTGWTTQSVNNAFTSDLLPGFSVSTTHDLWAGQVGSDTAKFSPFLTSLNASLSISGRTFRPIARLLGLAHKDSVLIPTTAAPTSTSALAVAAASSQFRSSASGAPPAIPRTGFTMTLNFSYAKQRPSAAPPIVNPFAPDTAAFGSPLNPFSTGTLFAPAAVQSTSSVSISTSFSPTQFWTVSWSTQYDFNLHAFQSHQVSLQRDLHDWRASFNFAKNVNGNYTLYFSMFLINLPEIKFDYNQSTLPQASATQSGGPQ